MGLKHRLSVAYRATRYCVELPGASLVLRVQRRAPTLRMWLAWQGLRRWALLTAWNPRSKYPPRLLPRGRNQARQQALQAVLKRQGYRSYAARNIPLAAAARKRWTEESLFVPGLSLYKARRLARHFGQVGFLAGCRSGLARLVFC
ncbi:MAG: DUF3293 domain-containing protein [Nevskiales bacterium]